MHKIADNGKPITRRAYSIDALRGYAILTMVLSATIVTVYYPHGCIMRKNRPRLIPTTPNCRD